MHITVSVWIPYMYIMWLSLSCCFDQLNCTLSNNLYFLHMLLTSPVKPGTETVSLSLFHIPQISSWSEKFPFLFCTTVITPEIIFPFSPHLETLWQSDKQDAGLACSGRAVPSLKLQTGLCRKKLGYLYPRRRDACLFWGLRWWLLTFPLPITKGAMPF